jgi:hypothetical protein
MLLDCIVQFGWDLNVNKFGFLKSLSYIHDIEIKVMKNFNKISREKWNQLKRIADMYEVVGYQFSKNVTYNEVKVWCRDKWDNIRYSHVAINENWY